MNLSRGVRTHLPTLVFADRAAWSAVVNIITPGSTARTRRSVCMHRARPHPGRTVASQVQVSGTRVRTYKCTRRRERALERPDALSRPALNHSCGTTECERSSKLPLQLPGSGVSLCRSCAALGRRRELLQHLPVPLHRLWADKCLMQLPVAGWHAFLRTARDLAREECRLLASFPLAEP